MSTERDQFYGRDILFNGDTPLDAGGDFIEIEGAVAFKQALYHRLLVAPGEYALRPDYGAGLGIAAKKRLVQSEIDSVQQRVIEQLSKEDRIQKIVEVVVESFAIGDKPGIRVYVKVLVAGQEVKLPMTFNER